MTKQQEAHLKEIISDFTTKCEAKYKLGQREHGGDLWLKKGLIDFAIEEAIDQVVYLLTLKKQIEESGVELGEIDDE